MARKSYVDGKHREVCSSSRTSILAASSTWIDPSKPSVNHLPIWWGQTQQELDRRRIDMPNSEAPGGNPVIPSSRFPMRPRVHRGLRRVSMNAGA